MKAIIPAVILAMTATSAWGQAYYGYVPAAPSPPTVTPAAYQPAPAPSPAVHPAWTAATPAPTTAPSIAPVIESADGRPAYYCAECSARTGRLEYHIQPHAPAAAPASPVTHSGESTQTDIVNEEVIDSRESPEVYGDLDPEDQPPWAVDLTAIGVPSSWRGKLEELFLKHPNLTYNGPVNVISPRDPIERFERIWQLLRIRHGSNIRPMQTNQGRIDGGAWGLMYGTNAVIYPIADDPVRVELIAHPRRDQTRVWIAVRPMKGPPIVYAP